MKKSLNKIVKLIRFEGSNSGHELFIVVGFLMVVGTFLKLMGVIHLDSDWFWFVAGLGLVVEGMTSLVKNKRFNQKYKVLTKEEFDRLVGEKSASANN